MRERGGDNRAGGSETRTSHTETADEEEQTLQRSPSLSSAPFDRTSAKSAVKQRHGGPRSDTDTNFCPFAPVPLSLPRHAPPRRSLCDCVPGWHRPPAHVPKRTAERGSAEGKGRTTGNIPQLSFFSSPLSPHLFPIFPYPAGDRHAHAHTHRTTIRRQCPKRLARGGGARKGTLHRNATNKARARTKVLLHPLALSSPSLLLPRSPHPTVLACIEPHRPWQCTDVCCKGREAEAGACDGGKHAEAKGEW